jgi:predicted DNA-binding ribbon-helix-helix protein
VYWKGLREIAEERGETLTHLIAGIDTDRQNANLKVVPNPASPRGTMYLY